MSLPHGKRRHAAISETPRMSAVPGFGSGHEKLSRLIYERIRLGIVSALAVNESLTFADLKAFLDTSDGNLSVHARKLEEAKYIDCKKTFVGRTPRTEYRLTKKGRAALAEYLEHMEALIAATRTGD